MNNVISFPEKKMKKVKKFQKIEAKRAIASFSVVTLIMGALVLNETYSRSVRPIYVISDNGSRIETLNRAIASAEPMNPFRDLEWEQSLAKKLGQSPGAQTEARDTRIPASVGHGVSSLDQLRFGLLEGKYHLLDQTEDASTKINEIEFIESLEANDRRVQLDPVQFLTKYGNLLSVKFDAFDKANPNQTNVREYRLLNGQKKVVGMAAFVIDDRDRFISLKVRAAGDSSF